MSSKNNKKDFDSDNDDIDTIDNDDELEASDEEDEEALEQEDGLIVLDTESKDCEIEDAIEKDNIFFDNNEEVELNITPSSEYVANENRISSNRLTKYEMVRILGERTKQLTMGAKPLIKNFQDLPYDKIAEEEFKKNMIPYKIVRPMPNGTNELWSLDELKKDHISLE